jgi:hypothetical protein
MEKLFSHSSETSLNAEEFQVIAEQDVQQWYSQFFSDC